MRYTPYVAAERQSLLRRRSVRVVAIVCLCAAAIGIGGYAIWHVINPDWRPLPAGVPGVLITRHSDAIILTRASSPQRMSAPAGQFVSVSPDGSLLLEDGHLVVNTLSGKQVSYVRAVIPVAGLQLSLWAAPDRVVLGSYQAFGLYLLHPNDAQAQVLSPDCQLGLYTPQALRSDGKSLLCLTSQGGLGVLSLDGTSTLNAISVGGAPSGAHITYASWTADGSRILFVLGYPAGTGPASHSDIVSVKSDGSGLTKLVTTSNDQFATVPLLSPDGQSLAYALLSTTNDPSHTPTFQIHVLGTNASKASKDVIIASGTGSTPTALAWSPDGRYLAYDSISPRGEAGSVAIVRLTSREQTTIDTNATLIGWSR